MRLQLVTLPQQLQDVGGRHQAAVAAEAAVERHELDEAHVHLALAREGDEGVELVLDAVEQERVDLDRREARVEGGVEAGERVGRAGRPRVIRAKRSASRLSRLTLTRRSPARRSSAAYAAAACRSWSARCR